MMMSWMMIFMALAIALILIAGIAIIGIRRNLREQEKRKNALYDGGKFKNYADAEDAQYFTIGADGELVQQDNDNIYDFVEDDEPRKDRL